MRAEPWPDRTRHGLKPAISWRCDDCATELTLPATLHGVVFDILVWGSSTPLRLPPASPGAAPRMGARYCAPHASGPAAGAGVSGAPPTETGPTGLGSGGRVAGRTGGETGRNNFRDAWTTRARGCGRGMLEVIGGRMPGTVGGRMLGAVAGGMLEVVDNGMLEVVSGVAGFCSELTCADSTAS